MPNYSENPRSCRAARCAVCDGKFGLARHYSWRTPLCSKKCVDRFRSRRNRNWVDWLQFAFGQLPEGDERPLRRWRSHNEATQICRQQHGMAPSAAVCVEPAEGGMKAAEIMTSFSLSGWSHALWHSWACRIATIQLRETEATRLIRTCGGRKAVAAAFANVSQPKP